MWITALTVPNDALVAEIKAGDAGIGSLPVVVEMIAVAAAGHAFRTIHLQSPARKVQGMDAIIAQFSSAPGPEPVPVVVGQIVTERFIRSRALPETPIEPRGDRHNLAVPDAG